MSAQNLDCYIIPSSPLPLLLPVECVSEVVAKPLVEKLSDAPASWMQGHVNWRTQRLPVLSYAGLHDPEADETNQKKPILVILNPIPNAARKTYSGLMCYGDVKRITVEPNLVYTDLPEGLDKRYVEAIVKVGKSDFIVPKLVALGVAFSYF